MGGSVNMMLGWFLVRNTFISLLSFHSSRKDISTRNTLAVRSSSNFCEVVSLRSSRTNNFNIDKITLSIDCIKRVSNVILDCFGLHY